MLRRKGNVYATWMLSAVRRIADRITAASIDSNSIVITYVNMLRIFFSEALRPIPAARAENPSMQTKETT